MKPPDSNLKYFAYCRKSTEGLERQALSIEAQVDKIREVFPKLEIIEVIEERHSAFIPGNRPQFTRMLERIRDGEADGLISWHPDRISRNEIEASQITWYIRQGIIKDLKFVSFAFDPSPEGLMMLQMTMSQSQYFSAKLSRDVKRGMDHKIKLGQKPGLAPEGYLNDLHAHTIVVDEQRFPLIRKGFDLMLTGQYSAPQVLDILNNQYNYRRIVRRNSGGNPLGRSVWYAILESKFYAGFIRHNGVWYKGAHKPMITMDEHETIQRLLGKRVKPNEAPKERFAYTGLIKCGQCQCAVIAEEKKKTTKAGKMHIWRYYHCTRRSIIRECDQRINVREELLDEMLEAEVARYSIAPEFQGHILEALRALNEREAASRTERYKAQHEAMEAAQTRVDSLIDMRASQLIDDDDFIRRRDAAKAEIERLRSEAAETEANADGWLETAERVINFAVKAPERFRNGNISVKRQIIGALGQNLTLFDGKLRLEPNEWIKPLESVASMNITQNERVRTSRLLPEFEGFAIDKPENDVMAGVIGLEPTTHGFGDHCSTN